METAFYQILWCLAQEFRSYLWGMETIVKFVVGESRLLIPILPMRHGNDFNPRDSSIVAAIPILPMRHGNRPQHEKSHLSSRWFRSYLWGMETHKNELSPGIRAEFRSYLWGMETTSICQTHIHNRGFRSYLWGMETSVTHMRYGTWKSIPILPMRHGNNQLTPDRLTLSLYSDPTYEAWKLE